MTPCIGLVMTAVGAVCALLWWRGRREGDEPRCARCGFVRIGLADDSAPCPERGRSDGAPLGPHALLELARDGSPGLRVVVPIRPSSADR
jgi:hypothetical protein